MNTGLRDGCRVARASIDLAGAAGKQLACECQTEPAIGAGDKNSSVLNFHKKHPRVRKNRRGVAFKPTVSPLITDGTNRLGHASSRNPGALSICLGIMCRYVDTFKSAIFPACLHGFNVELSPRS